MSTVIERIERKGVGDYTISGTAYDTNGDAVTITGTPTVAILDPEDADIGALTPSIVAGVLSVVVPNASLDMLGPYTATWTGTVGGVAQEWQTVFELVDGYYFTIPELRATDSQFTNETTYPLTKMEEAREWAEATFETAARRAWVERPAIETHIGDGGYYLHLGQGDIRSVVSVTVDGTAMTATELADLVVFGSGMLKNLSGWTSDVEIVVHYTYGMKAMHPRVKKAALILARQYVAEPTLNSRAISEQTDVGFIRLSIAAPGGRIGIPEVDAAAADLGRARTFIG